MEVGANDEVASSFSEERSDGAGGDGCDSELPDARRDGAGHSSEREPQEAGRDLPARGGGWAEYRDPARGAVLFPDAADDCHSAAADSGSGWIFRIASGDGESEAAVGGEAPGDCACGRLAGYDALALRCAGLHGVGHAGHQGDGRWMAESRAAGRRRTEARGRDTVSRGGTDGADATHTGRPSP